VTKLFVGNLPFSATEEAVRALFEKHGTVEKIALITDRETGRPRGFGFVEMANADASRAMSALNGTDFEGRSLKIDELDTAHYLVTKHSRRVRLILSVAVTARVYLSRALEHRIMSGRAEQSTQVGGLQPVEPKDTKPMASYFVEERSKVR
jgi:RNA recognition motif-containing protein